MNASHDTTEQDWSDRVDWASLQWWVNEAPFYLPAAVAVATVLAALFGLLGRLRRSLGTR